MISLNNMKRLVQVSSISDIEELNSFVDGFILGYKKFTSFEANLFDYEDIKNLSVLYPNKIYLNLNFMMHLNDQKCFEDEVIKLKELAIHFIIQDLGASLIAQKVLGDLSRVIFNPYTYITNSGDANAYLELGFESVVLSSEITLKDMNVIATKANQLTCVGFGYHPMYQTYRHIIDLYKEKNGFTFDNENLLIKEWTRNEYAHVFDNEYGSVVYRPYVLSLLDNLPNVDNVIINTIFFDEVQKEALFAYLKGELEYQQIIDKFDIQDGFKFVDSVYNPKEF